MMPPPISNACDCVLQLNITIAHVPGEINTAAQFLSRLDNDSNGKPIPKIREDVPTQPIEVNTHSTGIAQEDQLFLQADDVLMPSEEQLLQRKQDKRQAINTEPPVITVSHCYIKDIYTNTLTHSMEPFSKIPRILIEQNADPVFFNFKRRMLRSPFDEQILATNPRCNYYSRNEKRIIFKDDILNRQNSNDVGDVSQCN